MAEEKTKKKKAGIVKRILKWFGLALLVLLLIASIIFQAPWKVITLLAIVLLACTALPKPARKYFWLSVGVVVIALIIWVFLPEADGDWRPYTFDEELAALEAKRAIPDSENAAIIYNQLLKNYDEGVPEPNFVDNDCYDLTSSEPWTSDDHLEIAQWLKGQQSTIAALLEASKVEECQFPLSPFQLGLGETISHFTATRHWARLLIRAANNDLGDGRVEQALEKQIAVLQMAAHLYQQPTMIDLLVGMAIESLAVRQFKRFVVTGDVTEEHLALIDEALAKAGYDWNLNLPQLLEYEKLVAKKEFAKYYEINPEGKIRLSRDPWAEMRVWWKKQLEANQIEEMQTKNLIKLWVYLTYWQKKLIRAQTILYWFLLPSTPQKSAEIIDAAYEKYYAMADPGFNWQKEPEEYSITSLFSMRARFNHRYMVQLLAGMSEKLYYGIHDIYLRITSDKRGSQLLIRLRRYKNTNGRWPESLDDIKSLAPAEIFVDPVNDDSFVYKLTEENFTLYSKGKNGIDEDGEYSSDWPEPAKPDDIAIWSPRSRKTKEGNGDAEQQ